MIFFTISTIPCFDAINMVVCLDSPIPITHSYIYNDSSSPFFLNNGDHPGLIHVSHPLTGNNYHTWHQAMIMALTAKNKIGFVNGTIPKPTPNDLLFSIWCRCNSMVSSWTINAVSRDIANSLRYIDSSFEVWRDLHDRFNQSNRLRILRDELKEFQPVPIFQCRGLCIWSEHQQKEYVMQFLMGLNESYAQIRAQVLMMDPFPSINHVFSLVIQEEIQRNIGLGSTISNAEPMSFKSGSTSLINSSSFITLLLSHARIN
ncbi:hypothetical protein UlMin_005275 [Ulmus minor]